MQLRNIGKLVALTVLVTATSMVFAQGGGGGGGRGFGQGRGMFGQGGVTQLATRADVQRDLAVTDDQKSKITALNEKLREDRRNMMQDLMGGGGPPDQNEVRAAMEKFNAKAKEELAKILTADQMKRLDEINVQISGNRAIQQPAIQKALGLSEAQVKQINELQQKQQEAMRSLFEKVQNQEITREDMQASMQKNNKTMDDELAKILTADQAAKLKEMGGKPFKADPPPGGGGGL